MQKSPDEKVVQTQLMQDQIVHLETAAYRQKNREEQQNSWTFKEKEQKEERSQTTVINQNLGLMEEFISLTTDPVGVSNGKV